MTQPTNNQVRRTLPNEPAGGWRPIEELPGKGLRVLILSTDRYVTIAARVLGGEFFDGFGQHVPTSYITHWQPLPAPPLGREGEG